MGDSTVIKAVSLKDFSQWVTDMLNQVFQAIQGLSTPLFMVIIAVSGFVLVLGVLFGSSRLRGAGGGGLILVFVAYLIVKHADTIIGVLESIGQSAP